MSNGRRVVVTAAAGGIGLAIARAFAGDGDRVHICDINEGSLREVTDANPGITATVCDVSDRSAVEAFVAAAAEALGGIDVLVNNAGISGPTTPVEEMEPDQWEAVLAVNLTGTFNVTRLSVPHLKRSAAGVIISMASVGGRFGYPDRSPYATTKRGVIAFTETLALELGGDGIRVNAIAPGAVAGERIERVLRGRAEASGRTVEEEAGRRPGQPGPDVLRRPGRHRGAGPIPRLGRARSISGQTIAIDGFSHTPAGRPVDRAAPSVTSADVADVGQIRSVRLWFAVPSTSRRAASMSASPRGRIPFTAAWKRRLRSAGRGRPTSRQEPRDREHQCPDPCCTAAPAWPRPPSRSPSPARRWCPPPPPRPRRPEGGVLGRDRLPRRRRRRPGYRRGPGRPRRHRLRRQEPELRPGPQRAGPRRATVSNGRDVTTTDSHGRYELPAFDNMTVFVTQPRGYQVPVDEDNVAQFFYHHLPEGSRSCATAASTPPARCRTR